MSTDPVPGSERPADEILEDLVLPALLDSPSSEWPRLIGGFQQQFPSQAELILERLETLRDLGLLGDPEQPLASSLGPYRLLQEIGSGGQGRVFLAEDPRLGRRVAIKVLSERFATARDRERMQREAEALSKVDHPGICGIHEVGEHDGAPFIVMQFVDGDALATRLRLTTELSRTDRGSGATTAVALPDSSEITTRPKATPAGREVGRIDRAVELGERIARALHAAHMAGLVHRDVKPGNIIVTPGGDPVLVDFGLARDEDSGAITRTGEVLGTPVYMAPEQLRGGATDRRTDIYCLGVTLFECLTLERPFRSADLSEALRERDGGAPDPRRINARVSGDLAIVLQKAMAPDPDERYVTAWELAEDLQAIRESRSIKARPISALGRARRWARREPRQALLLLLVALLIPVSAGLVGYLLAERETIEAGRRAQEQEFVDTQLANGYVRLGEGAPDDAIRIFEAVLAAAPAEVEAVAGIGLAHILRAQPGAALEFLEKRGDARVIERVRVLALERTGRADDAWSIEQRLGAPREASEWFVRGMQALNRGVGGDERGYPEAIEAFTQAMVSAAQPRQVYYFLRSQAAELSGNGEVALRTADAMEEVFGDSAEAWLRIGTGVAQFDLERAIRSYRRSLELDPNSHQARASLGVALYMNDETDPAREQLRLAIGLYPENVVARVVLGMTFAEEESWPEAIGHYRDALAIEPDYAAAHAQLLTALQASGDTAGLQAEQARWAALGR